MKTLLLAEWVAPMDGPMIQGGAIAFDEGRIIAVGQAHSIRASHPDSVIVDAGNAIILPGLVNAHTHLELSDCDCGPAPGGEFADWLVGMLRRTRISADEMARKVALATPRGIEQCLKFGVSCVGDISRQCGLTRQILRTCPLRAVSFGEVQAMAQRRHLLEERLAIAADDSLTTDRLRIGLSPHAPYSVEPEGYRRCLQVAHQQHLSLATHLAESLAETPFLAEHRGPLRDLWDAWLTWDNDVPTFAGGPIRYARELGLLDGASLLAHVNYCDDDEMAILAAGHASVVFCPRTHAYFGHPPHRWREMLARGINVAIGTDSCASSPDLNLVDDLRLLHRMAPQVPTGQLWEMATIRAARAIGMEAAIGTLTPGKAADMVIFPASGTNSLDALLERPVLPDQLWINGERVRV